MSISPWPERLNNITGAVPSSLARFASRMAAAIACELSGAGIMPSARAKVCGCGKCLKLGYVDSVNHAVAAQLADDSSRTMIAETAGMYIGRREIVAEGIHRNKRSITGLIAEIVLQHTACQFRTRRRLCCNKTRGALSRKVMAHEREGYARKVRAAAEASDNNVGILSGHLHLFLSLQADYSLVECHMIEHRAEHILAVGGRHGKPLRPRR